MKKALTILLTCLLIFALTACARSPVSSIPHAVGQVSPEIVQSSLDEPNTQATEVVSTSAAIPLEVYMVSLKLYEVESTVTQVGSRSRF